MKLNGWQRLWVVIAGLWVVALGVFWVNELFDINKDIFNARYRLATDISVWEKHGCARRGIASTRPEELFSKESVRITICDDSVNKTYNSKESPKDFFQNSFDRYFQEKDDYKAKQFAKIYRAGIYEVNEQLDRRSEAIVLGIGFILLPPISIYLAGLAFVWIRKGFKREQS